jgi:hypothetical protein
MDSAAAPLLSHFDAYPPPAGHSDPTAGLTSLTAISAGAESPSRIRDSTHQSMQACSRRPHLSAANPHQAPRDLPPPYSAASAGLLPPPYSAASAGHLAPFAVAAQGFTLTLSKKTIGTASSLSPVPISNIKLKGSLKGADPQKAVYSLLAAYSQLMPGQRITIESSIKNYSFLCAFRAALIKLDIPLSIFSVRFLPIGGDTINSIFLDKTSKNFAILLGKQLDNPKQGKQLAVAVLSKLFTYMSGHNQNLKIESLDFSIGQIINLKRTAHLEFTIAELTEYEQFLSSLPLPTIVSLDNTLQDFLWACGLSSLDQPRSFDRVAPWSFREVPEDASIPRATYL